MKKETKKSKATFTSTEVGVIVEDLRSQFGIFGDKLKALDDKLDSTMGMVAKNTEDITMLNLNVSVIKSDLTKINGKLAKIEQDVGVIKSDFGKRLTALETSLK